MKKVKIIYKGGQEEEVIECDEWFGNAYGGFTFVTNGENILISTSDIRKIFEIRQGEK